eukprot:gb/GEZN01019914.1/.p1 GENE.gb/GEZN01019914.1/~~gb/GEZN01019914.1/.p1  ORF type:complete len:214 (+),score=0.90 gb/GEZN01019914.1/:1-642(+)
MEEIFSYMQVLPFKRIDNNLFLKKVLIHEEPYLSIEKLLSLANGQSNNFTSEVLLRQASNDWLLNNAIKKEEGWLSRQGVSFTGLRLVDGSGLSSSNRLTSHFLSSILLYMSKHIYSEIYQNSMALSGARGTMRDFLSETVLSGRLNGKTGTLKAVRSISGILTTSAGPIYVSILSNGSDFPDKMIKELLLEIQKLSPCPAFSKTFQFSTYHG